MSIVELDSIEKTFQALDSENTFQNIAIISELDSCANENKLRDQVKSISSKYPRLNKVMKGNYWVKDEKINIQDHIIVKNFNEALSDSELSKNLSSDIKINEKFWKVVLYNCQKGESYLATIFHHSFTDGMGMIEFNKDLFIERTKDGRLKNKLRSNNKKRKKASAKNIVKNKLTKIRKHRAQSKNTSSYLKSLLVITKDFLVPKADSKFNGTNSNIRKFHFIKLDLDQVNEIRRSKKLSLHEYMLTIFIKALKSQTKLNRISILTPISHRNPKSSLTFGNYITGMPIYFSTKLKDIDKLSNYVSKKFRKEISSKKNQAYIALSKLMSVLPKSLRKKLCNFTARKTHFICTSVPSSSNSIFELAGAKVVAQYPVAALMKGHGMALGFTRYNNKVNICMISDPNIIAAPEDLIKDIKIAANE